KGPRYSSSRFRWSAPRSASTLWRRCWSAWRPRHDRTPERWLAQRAGRGVRLTMAGDFLAHLPPAWHLAFSENALARGRAYAEEDRVIVLREEDRFVEATCSGSGANRYRQSLMLDKRDTLSCVCTC